MKLADIASGAVGIVLGVLGFCVWFVLPAVLCWMVIWHTDWHWIIKTPAWLVLLYYGVFLGGLAIAALSAAFGKMRA